MKKIKKYDWGTFSASAETPQMVNPGNAALKQYTTTSSSTIPTGALPASGNISQLINSTKAVPESGGFGGFMGKYGSAITQAAGALMPLLMKKRNPNEKPYRKGTKMIKYQGGVDSTILIKKGKGTPWDTMVDTQTGQRTPILSSDTDVEEKVETPVVRKKATPAPAPAPKKSPVYDSALGEYGLGFGIPLITELAMGNPKSKIGRTAKRLIKGAIAARRLGSDIISDVKEGGLGNIKWTERGLNFMKDYALAEGGAGVARTVRGYKPKYKEQVKKAATDVENPVAPSRRRAVKESAQEAALEQSRTSKIVKGAISYIKDNSPEGKQAKINLKNATIKENAARRKFTGKAGNDQYFVKGKPVDQKTYTEYTEPRNKTAKRIKELREEFFNPPQYIQDLKKQDPNYRQTAYVQEKMGQYHSKREAEGAKDFSEDVKTFTEKFRIERNKITTQPKPQGMSDEDFKAKVSSELGELNKTQEAVVKAFEARKTKRKADREAAEKLAQNKATESSAPPVEQTTKPERASRKTNKSATEQVNDLTEGRRETSEPTQKKRGSATKGSNKKGAQSEESGPSDGPTMNASELGVVPSNKGGRKKANGARLIKYK